MKEIRRRKQETLEKIRKQKEALKQKLNYLEKVEKIIKNKRGMAILYQCGFCKRIFFNKASVNNHERTHK